MNLLSRKLNSRSGASILLALLFLLIALTVGAIVLTSASANAGRIERNRQDQQNYLAVRSAALLLRDDLANASFTASYTKQVRYHTETRGTAPNTYSVTVREPDTYTDNAASEPRRLTTASGTPVSSHTLFDDSVISLYKYLNRSVSCYLSNTTYTKSLNLSITANEPYLSTFEITDISVMLGEDAAFKFELSYKNTNPVVVTIPAEIKLLTPVKSPAGGHPQNYDMIYKTQIIWGTPVITKGKVSASGT